MVKLVLVRHGESLANAENVYTGWNDVALSSKGIKQAQNAGLQVKSISDFNPTMIHTSLLSRAIVTANIIAEECNLLYLPISKTWRLNERHYGALRGLNKDVSRTIYGKEKVLEWRRGFDSIPPLLDSPLRDHRYQQVDNNCIPLGESLHQTQIRLMPYYHDAIAAQLVQGNDQMIVAHGSSLRALIKKLENINDNDIVNLEVPNAQPIVYTFNSKLEIVDKQILGNI